MAGIEENFNLAYSGGAGRGEIYSIPQFVLSELYYLVYLYHYALYLHFICT